jgi:NTE family protein
MPRPPFECIALTLQGGGALGAYQAGVFQALTEAGIEPDWVAGISIGAINAAIIAGNAPAERVAKLKGFWDEITAQPAWAPLSWLEPAAVASEKGRQFFNQLSAAKAMLHGVPDFFTPRFPPPNMQPTGSSGAISYYDTAPLRATLERYVDFDRINAGRMRLSVGTVNVRTGNFVYFDTADKTQRIDPKHIMASGALPPGFPAIEIDGEHYWDGGLVSNTPLQWVLEHGTRQDTLTFQVDLWSARGRLPQNMMEVATRQQEIIYSSRTRDNVSTFIESERLRNAIAELLEEMPAKQRASKEMSALRALSERKVYNIVHLIYRTRKYEGDSKDYEFSQLSMHDHWDAGYKDTVHTLQHREALEPTTNKDGIACFDFTEHETA